MATGFVKEKNLEKQIQRQMGCMAGFLQIFDRHHILTGKRFHAARRLLPSSPAGDTTSESGKSAPPSPASIDLGKQAPARELPLKSPLPLPVFELKDGARSPWKFGKEAPRLSLDSRATTDAKGGLHPKQIRTAASVLSSDDAAADAGDGGQQHRSPPSVIARLMGLEQLPDSSDSPPEKQPELRRSASESRVSKDLFHSRLMADYGGSNSKPPAQLHPAHYNNAAINPHYTDPMNQSMKKGANADFSAGVNRGGLNPTMPWRAPQPRKSFFDSGDVFPEPKQNISIYGEIEKRLKMRGIDETSKDLDTLKQILEALQLKGLLHSKPPPSPQQNHGRHRNFVYDESSIVLMKPTRSSPSRPSNRTFGSDYSQPNGRKQVGGVRRNYSPTGETSPSPSPRRERNTRSPIRSGRSPSPSPIPRSNEGGVNGSRSNSPAKPKQALTQRRVNQSAENRRVSPVRSPKISGTGPDRSPRMKKPTVAINQKEKSMAVFATEDAYSSVSGSSVTTSTDTERWKAEELKEGKSLLERCDQLLNSIAEFAATDMQPSPVSVLDSSFYKDESLTPSPVTTKRNINFKDILTDHYGESEEEMWSPVVSPIRSKRLNLSEDGDFVYVSDILKASHYLPEKESDIFLLLENQQHIKGNDTSKVSRLQRKMIFDTISEILEKGARLPPWKSVSSISLDWVWSEFQRIRECDTADDLFETICRVLKKDLEGDATTGWGDCPMEVSEVILDIERSIFKDTVSEIIEDLSSPPSPSMMLRRKLVF